MMPRLRGLFHIGAMISLAGVAGGAQPDRAVGGPDESGRVVARFDFEEQDINPLPVPRGWIRAQHDPVVPRERPGFAAWNRAELDYAAPAFSGVGSVRLPTNGDSTSLQLQAGVIPVFPTSDYLVTAMVRTDRLDHAGAALAARLLNESGDPIPGSEHLSDIVQTRAGWQPLAVSVLGEFPDAAFLQVELMLLQPQHQPGRQGDRYTIWREDIGGRAWFDDVTVVRMPRVELSAGPGGVVITDGTPALDLRVRDLTGTPMAAEVSLLDVAGRLVDRTRFEFRNGRLDERWTPSLPGFGWYRAAVTVAGREGAVGGASLDLVWMPPADRASAWGTGGARRVGTDRLRFHIEATRLPPVLHDQLRDILWRSGAGSATIPLWSESLTLDGVAARVDELAPLVDRLITNGVQVGISLPRTPRALAAQLGAEEFETMRLFRADPALWGPFVVPAFDRFGQTVRHWHVGLPGSTQAFRSGTLEEDLGRLRTSLEALVPGPIIDIPWRAELAFDGDRLGESLGETSLSMLIPAGAGSEQISAAIDRALRSDGGAGEEGPGAGASAGRVPASITAVLEIDRERITPRGDAIDAFARRGVELWRSATSTPTGDRVRLGLPDPWTLDQGRTPIVRPEPELAVFRTLTDQLSDRVFLTEYEPQPGLRALLFGPGPRAALGRGGLLVVWSEDPRVERLEITLGAGPVRVTDPMGNTSVVEADPTPGTERRVHRVPVDRGPRFIEGIDTGLVRFLASVRISEPFLPATIAPHNRELVLDNPWPVPIRGRALIVEPSGFSNAAAGVGAWRVGPRISAFSIPANGTTRVPFSAAFPAVELAGAKSFVIDFEIRAHQEYPWSRTVIPVEIGSQRTSLALYQRYVRDAAGTLGLVIEARVLNLSDELLSIELLASAPGGAIQRASVSDLSPETEIVRTFAFANAESIRGQRVVVSLYDRTTGDRLNREIEIQ